MTITGQTGGAYLPELNETSTITFAGDSRSSTLDSGAVEVARFGFTGSAGTQTPGVVTVEVTNLPTSITYDNTRLDGGAAVSQFVLWIARTTAAGTALGEFLLIAHTSGDDSLADYASRHGLSNGATISGVEFIENLMITQTSVLRSSTGITDLLITNRTSSSITFTFRQADFSQIWTGVGEGVSAELTLTVNGTNSGATSTSTFTTATSLGSRVNVTIPYIGSDGTQRTYASSPVIFQTTDTTPALLAQRFIDEAPRHQVTGATSTEIVIQSSSGTISSFNDVDTIEIRNISDD